MTFSAANSSISPALDLITPAWSCPPNIVAYTTTRMGGASVGDFAGLNVGAHVGDDLMLVKANRSLIPHSEKITWLEQVHSNRVVSLPSADTTADAAVKNAISRFKCKSNKLIAWVGPAISGGCYEVDAELANKFRHVEGAISDSANKGKFLLDLPRVTRVQLQQSGVENITLSNLCTYTDEKRFYSHRRATHQNKRTTGRMVSVIGIL